MDDGAGNRTFEQEYFFGEHMSQALSLADVDSDGDLDLAVGGSNLTATATPVANLLCLNDGMAGFTCTPEFGTGRTHEIEFGDFDHDGVQTCWYQTTAPPWPYGGTIPLTRSFSSKI